MKCAAAILLAFFCWSCAPLTPPEISSSAPGGEGDKEEEEISSALDRYLHFRRLSADPTAATRPYIAVLPFVDKSGFRKGVWDLEWEMARLLSGEMAAFPEWQVVPHKAVNEVAGKSGKPDLTAAIEFGRALEADIVLLGIIQDYNLERLSVGDPMLGGYKSYSGIAKLELRAVRVDDQSEVGMVEAERELVDRDLGLDLLGKPRDQDLQFAGLQQVAFGGEEFRSTVLGQATIEAIDELLQKLVQQVRPQALNLGGQPAELLSVYGTDVYINIGSENRLRVGYRFEVLPGSQRVRQEGVDPLLRIGVVEVQEIIGARLSSVRVLEGENSIRAGDRLRLMVPEKK